MASTTVRLNRETWEILHDLSKQAGEPMQKVLAKAIEAYRRQSILEQTNAAYATLRADVEAWSTEEQERREWEVTLADGQRE